MTALLLLTLGLLDAGFSGFRASAGRDGRIRKRRANLLAARRGLLLGAAVLLVPTAIAVALVLTAADPVARYGELDAAGRRMATVYVPYALTVGLSLVVYLVGPFRLSTLAMVIGLGPLTLLRPLVVAVGAVAAAWGSLPAAAVAVTAAAGILLVEPLTHRRWYHAPL